MAGVGLDVERTDRARRGDCGTTGLVYERAVLAVKSLPRFAQEVVWERFVGGPRVDGGGEDVKNNDFAGAKIKDINRYIIHQFQDF